MDERKLVVLRAIAEHDGEMSWYQLDRFISNGTSGCVGPFRRETRALAAEGLIKIDPRPELPGHVRYWLTERGRTAMADAR